MLMIPSVVFNEAANDETDTDDDSSSSDSAGEDEFINGEDDDDDDDNADEDGGGGEGGVRRRRRHRIQIPLDSEDDDEEAGGGVRPPRRRRLPRPVDQDDDDDDDDDSDDSDEDSDDSDEDHRREAGGVGDRGPRRRRFPRLLGEDSNDERDSDDGNFDIEPPEELPQVQLQRRQQQQEKKPETSLEVLLYGIERSHAAVECALGRVRKLIHDILTLVVLLIWFGIVEVINIYRFPLHNAVKRQLYTISKILIKLGCDVNRVDNNQLTPLHIAMRTKNLRLVRYLFDHGADVNRPDDNGDIPLHDMSWIVDRNLVRKLVDSCTDIDIVAEHKRHSPLHLAVRANNVYQVQLLLESGADVDSRTTAHYKTPLHRASQMKDINPKIIELLIKHESDVNSENFGNYTPLHFSMRWGHLRTTRTLIAHGADIYALTMDDRTMLQCAANNEYVELVEELLAMGFDPDERHTFEKWATYEAAECGSARVCETLLRKSKLRDQKKMPFIVLAARDVKRKLKVTMRYYALEDFRHTYTTDQPIFEEEHVIRYLERAKAELEALENVALTKELTGLQFMYDIMDGRDDKVAKYASDTSIRRKLRSWKSAFPVFNQTVKNVYHREVRKQKRKRDTARSICKVLKLNGPDHIVCRKIMEYLELPDFGRGSRFC